MNRTEKRKRAARKTPIEKLIAPTPEGTREKMVAVLCTIRAIAEEAREKMERTIGALAMGTVNGDLIPQDAIEVAAEVYEGIDTIIECEISGRLGEAGDTDLSIADRLYLLGRGDEAKEAAEGAKH